MMWGSPYQLCCCILPTITPRRNHCTPFRTSPVLPEEILRCSETIKSVEEFIFFCRAHQITSHDFDRPSVSGDCLFARAFLRRNLALVRYMVEERLKSDLSWRKSDATSAHLPSPNLLYAKLCANIHSQTLLYPHQSALQALFWRLDNSKEWLHTLDFILEQAPLLVNLSDGPSPLYEWLLILLSPSLENSMHFLAGNGSHMLRRLIGAGAVLSADPNWRAKELSFMKNKIVQRCFLDVFGEVQGRIIIDSLKNQS